MRDLRTYHNCGHVCYLPIKNDVGEILKEAKPRSNWCRHCKEFPPEAVDYSDAKWERRSAKERMKRACKKLR